MLADLQGDVQPRSGDVCLFSVGQQNTTVAQLFPPPRRKGPGRALSSDGDTSQGESAAVGKPSLRPDGPGVRQSPGKPGPRSTPRPSWHARRLQTAAGVVLMSSQAPSALVIAFSLLFRLAHPVGAPLRRAVE